MLFEPRRIEHAPVGVVDLAYRPSRRQGLGHLLERLPDGGEEVPLVAGGLAHRQGAHHGGVIVAVGAGPLQRQLVDRVHAAHAGGGAEQEGAGPGADDHLVRREVPAALEDGALQGRQNVTLEDAGPRRLHGPVEAEVREPRGLPHVRDLRRGLDSPQGW